MSGPNIISDKRRAQAKKHAARAWMCNCGKVCHGNGGISSHKKACSYWMAAMVARAAQEEHS